MEISPVVRQVVTLSPQIIAYALFMGIAGMVFFYIGISMGWLYVSDSVFAFWMLSLMLWS